LEIVIAPPQRQLVGGVLAVAYVLTILLANYAITHWENAPAFPGGPYTVPVWPGIEATSGVLFAGFAFIFRDLTQEWLGRKAVIVAILVGALLSWVVTSNRDLAVASAVAFLFSELRRLRGLPAVAGAALAAGGVRLQRGRLGDRLDSVLVDRLRQSRLHRRADHREALDHRVPVVVLLALRR
jgi:hypothetical protein